MKIAVALALFAFVQFVNATLEEVDPITGYFRGLRPYRYVPREEILEEREIIEEEREFLRRRFETLEETPLGLDRILDPFVEHPGRILDPYVGHPGRILDPYVGHPGRILDPYVGHPGRILDPYVGHPGRILDPYVGHPGRILDPYFGINRIVDPYVRWINRGYTGFDRTPFSWRGRDRVVDPYFTRWTNRIRGLSRVPDFERVPPRVWGFDRILDPYYRGVDRFAFPYLRTVNRMVEHVNEEIERPTAPVVEKLKEVERILDPYFKADRIVRGEGVREVEIEHPIVKK